MPNELQGLDHWIEGDTPRGAGSEWRSPRPEPQATSQGPSLLPSSLDTMTPAETLLRRFYEALQPDWRTSDTPEAEAHRTAFEKEQGQ